MNRRHRREARQLQESIDRRLSDQRILELLAREGFRGPRYDQFVDELVRYGISVLRGWMHSGFVFQLTADRGFGLNPHENDLEKLASDSDLREELANMTVACALPRFRQRALIDGGWTYEGGASITTYFMGACLYDFPNEFRRYRAGEERYRRALQRQQDFYEVPVGHLSVSDEVIGNLEVLRYLYEISDPRLQKAVALTIDGCSQEAIRQILDEKSVRAIEALLYRWRTKKKRDGGEGDQHDQSPGR
ncbi:hypothetical protein OG889_44980 [Streptomyces sp. NBC_00481]|uniref:hypothetical protein n=1 Tax=Streptomyces sp. NBC_00481 TaxID=2975755 RepID=UPI002DD87301|nr:hypothetical protein [Streptomyces sp. NBC_00481]WRZ01207.1 hypothetical protein OG889_44980 [Streptomyces sp. NBC_00481]